MENLVSLRSSGGTLGSEFSILAAWQIELYVAAGRCLHIFWLNVNFFKISIAEFYILLSVRNYTLPLDLLKIKRKITCHLKNTLVNQYLMQC